MQQAGRDERPQWGFKSRGFRENFERIADSFSAKDEMFNSSKIHSLRMLLTGCSNKLSSNQFLICHTTPGATVRRFTSLISLN